MRNTRLTILPILGSLLVALALPAAAQMYGPDYEKCSRGTTVAIVNCVNAGTKSWARRLNSAYQALVQRLETAEREPLKATQRLWIQYRDANCRFYASGEGSIRQIAAAECLRAMTQQRACEIEVAKNLEGKAGAGCR